MKPILFFAALLALMYGATRYELVYGPRLVPISPTVVTDDEPHYILSVNTLLFHHRLELQDAYANLKISGEAGPYQNLDHHTIVVNRSSGYAAPWNAHDPLLTPGPNVYEVSLHPMAFPLLLAGILAPFHPALADVQRDVSLLIVLISWLTCIVVYLTTGTLVAPAILGLCSPWLVYAKGFWSEPVTGLALAAALWAVSRSRWRLSMFFCGIAAALKLPFIVAGIGLILARWQWRQVVEMSLVLGVCGALLLGWNWWLARTFLIPPRGQNEPYATALETLYDSFLSPKFGLFIFAPWTILAIAGLRRWPGVGCALVLYAAAIGVTHVYAGGVGPRYWVAFMPWLAVLAAKTPDRQTLLVLCLFSAALAIPCLLRYRELFEQPVTAAWCGLW